jgi:REP element-mobilizing transposase RayT
MWNDTDIPLAHLITFRSYGSWLHGDARGAVDRFHNQYKSPYIPANENWQRHNTQTLKFEPVLLNAAQRQSVEVAVRETCTSRNWLLRALNVRTNHVHTVVSIGETKADRALSALKTNATRQMRQDNCWQLEHSPWVSKGSKRNLWNERSIERAVFSVLYGQGDELPDFD